MTPIEQVRTAKARYCRYADTRQWAAFAALLSVSPEILIYDTEGALAYTFDSADSFTAACSAYLEGAQSIHQVHNEEMTQVSDSEIHAIWSMEDCVIFPPADAASDPRPARHHGYGHYHETWVREGEAWRLKRMELRRTILEITAK